MKHYCVRHYYVRHYHGFYNCYDLYSVEAGSAAETELREGGFSRITRQEALSRCREERDRRRYDKAFSGYAPAYVEDYESAKKRIAELL